MLIVTNQKPYHTGVKLNELKNYYKHSNILDEVLLRTSWLFTDERTIFRTRVSCLIRRTEATSVHTRRHRTSTGDKPRVAAIFVAT